MSQQDERECNIREVEMFCADVEIVVTWVVREDCTVARCRFDGGVDELESCSEAIPIP
jgi:hypothetical protein